MSVLGIGLHIYEILAGRTEIYNVIDDVILGMNLVLPALIILVNLKTLQFKRS